MKISGRLCKGDCEYVVVETPERTIWTLDRDWRKLAFRVSTSIAAFARGTGSDAKVAAQEIAIQKAFAFGHTFIIGE